MSFTITEKLTLAVAASVRDTEQYFVNDNSAARNIFSGFTSPLTLILACIFVKSDGAGLSTRSPSTSISRLSKTTFCLFRIEIISIPVSYTHLTLPTIYSV